MVRGIVGTAAGQYYLDVNVWVLALYEVSSPNVRMDDSGDNVVRYLGRFCLGCTMYCMMDSPSAPLALQTSSHNRSQTLG